MLFDQARNVLWRERVAVVFGQCSKRLPAVHCVYGTMLDEQHADDSRC